MAGNNQQEVKCTSVMEHMHLLYATAGMVICSQYMYHLHKLLYSLQHQLPTRSVLHHDDHSDLPHRLECHCPEKIKHKRITGITNVHE